MKKTIISSILLLLSFTLFAQLIPTSKNAVSRSTSFIPSREFVGKSFTADNYLNTSRSYKKISGNPYINDTTAVSYLVTNNDEIVKDVPLKMDAYADLIIATNQEGEDILLDVKYYKQIVLTQDYNEIQYAKVNPSFPDKFYEVLYQKDEHVFFKDTKVRIKEGKNNGITNTPSKFLKSTEYYIKQGAEVTKIKLKKKHFLALFSKDDKAKMEQYAKTNKLKIKKENDFVLLLSVLHQ